MTSQELRQKYLDFFKTRGHKVIPSAPLVPENDPSILFTTAGMHPLVPFLLGQPHPQGQRIVDIQKCVRTNDIDEVGDLCHHTFFEMLGNWSLGDYWKKEAITWTYEFLTEELKLDPNRLFVTCFAGDEDAPKDEESASVWQSLGIPLNRIFFNGKDDNWWAAPGDTGPCGPDSEIFFDLTGQPCEDNCRPGCGCGRFPEIGNNVFMEYNKTIEGKFEKLTQRNVDFGGGLERILAVTNGLDDDYLTDVFLPAIQELEKLSKLEYGDKSDDEYIKDGKQCWVDVRKQFRVIVDHLRASVFIIADGVEPSNKERGYILRRLIRRASLQLKKLGVKSVEESCKKIADVFINLMSSSYPELEKNRLKIISTLENEINKFSQTLEKGLKELKANITQYKRSDQAAQKAGLGEIPFKGGSAFYMYESYGFPPELTLEELQKDLEIKSKLDINKYWQHFNKRLKEHQEKSRTASAGMFKGGLSDHSEETTKYHTATHLLHAALRQILGEHVEQKGSNITSERMRFDFSHPEKLTEEQLEQIESLVNEKIQENLPITSEIMDKEKALKSGALGFFTEKYGDKVTVYSIGDPSTRPECNRRARSGFPFSREICGGPHVQNTGQLGHLQIIKEESAGANIRRIYVVLS